MKAAQLSRLLGGSGQANSEGWHSCRCPAHADTVFSLGLKDVRRGRLLIKCFVDCPVDSVATELKKLAASGVALPPAPAAPTQAPVDTVAAARRAWEETLELANSHAERELRRRGISLDLSMESLRAHPGLRHPSGSYHPAMVAAVCNAEGEQFSVHRTWFAADGSGKANVTPNKMSLGPVKGHAVHLGEGGGTLIVGEGIETSLSAMQLFGAPAWATLSASNLPNVVIPPEYSEIIIAADNDPVGLAAAEKLRLRLTLQRRKVRILKPTIAGQDFNDVLMSKEGVTA